MSGGSEDTSQLYESFSSVCEFLLAFALLTVIAFVSLVLRVVVSKYFKMSIILTAGRKAVSKSAKPKKKRRSAGKTRSRPETNFATAPPISTEKTTVWYWDLEGIPTTVMFSKDMNEVWCNGEILDTIDEFTQGPSDPDGATLDFCIHIQETGASHKARIQRYRTGEGGRILHRLYVDGYLVEEHTGTTASHQQTPYSKPPEDQYTANCPDYGAPANEYPYPFRPDPYEDQYEEDEDDVNGHQSAPYSTPAASSYAPEEGAVAFNASFSVPGPPCYEDVMAEEDKKNK